MKKLVCCLAVASLLALGGSAIADICTIEATPAATLLLPYFEVDLADTGGVDTFFSINNASDASVMTHVVLWTDLSVEALDFNVYLTGYDVQTIALGLLIREGILPVTGDANAVSNRGAFSDLHPGSQTLVDGYPGCAELAEWPYSGTLTEEYLDHLQSILTGGPSTLYGGNCGAVPYGDDIARGYVTVDVTNDCTLLTPCDSGYFRPDGIGGDQIGEYDNVLWGDWYMVDFGENFAQGDTLVHIEASPDPFGISDVGDSLFGGGTFWQRCMYDDVTLPFTSLIYPYPDYREPLPSTFATRFYQNDAFAGGTDLIVWRESPDGVNVLLGEDNGGFDCDLGPGWINTEVQIVAFDEEENPDIPTPCTVSPCPDPEINVLFPWEAQRVSVSDIELPFQSGWLFLNLNHSISFFYYPYYYLSPGSFTHQNWVTSVHSADGRFSVGLAAIQLDSVCDFTSVTLGVNGPFVEPSITISYYYGYCSYYPCYIPEDPQARDPQKRLPQTPAKPDFLK